MDKIPKYAFISQPMAGLTDEEIMEARKPAIETLERLGYTVFDNFYGAISAFADAIWLLGSSIQALSQCDLAYFCVGWEKARGCRVEHQYGIPIMEAGFAPREETHENHD